MKFKLPPLRFRRQLYLIAAAVLALLVAYKLIDVSAVPLWLALAGAVLGLAGNSVAATAATQQIRAERPVE
jgi:small-conductance mechanosensitive channel